MSFPAFRSRRLRRTEALRRISQEVELSPRHLIAPLFVKEGIPEPLPVPSLPGQVQHTLPSLVKEVGELVELGVGAVILFGIPAHKDAVGSGAWDEQGVVQRALRTLRSEFGDRVVLMADLCLCEYTDHGHCGVLAEGPETVDNDRTLELYGRIAASQARAGADVIAPSGVMDGQVAAIRRALDEAGYPQVAILSYAAKFASTFYGPFRDAAESAPRFGHRRAYQLAPANLRAALRRVEEEVAEGADAVMVKPALPYLDVVRAVRERWEVPVAAYCVSGEYAMLHAAAQRGWLDLESAMMEVLLAIRRAGADWILTYFAKDAARLLR
ncbi:MAG: porphobilinogen synthase [Armatimonadota bacterium]|nr:porphobilinogen synthase [Armatimonadota bacterium]MDR7565553.1 porphobilinogen synthase [Armatimonadota bacterium]MDR7577822.1 porphobilinogen synthase [Armatimonadota bacterium]MDR7580786.1 porphobilinogen synthase [Armatimonadota bacterium]MDR7594610.1 porphobilinogen synthase [Armatimonadota bacterium]